jgi:LPS-assembly lipoprotein
MRGVLRWLAPAALALAVAGCGFRMQGATALPEGLDKVFVATKDELSPFAVELRKAIDGAGAELADNAGEADAVVRITQDRTGRRVLSVSSRNTPQEYQIFYAVEFSVERGTEQVVAPQPIELTRAISFSESDVLAKDREERILRDAMARDLADLVLRRLESLPR